MHPKYKPNKAFFRFLKDDYSRAKHGYTGVSVSEDIKKKLLNSAYGWTAWFLTKDGAKILFRLIGIRRMYPHDGYIYYYVPPHGEKQEINSSHNLMVFRKVPAEMVDMPQAGVTIAKRVVYTEGWEIPPDKAFDFTFSSYRKWLKTKDGMEWCKSRFESVMRTEALDGLAYKATSVNGESYWFGDAHIQTEPKEFDNCEGCDYDYPCIDNYTGLGNLCCRCYAEHFADGEALAICNRHECKDFGCHNYIEDRNFYEKICEVTNLPIRYTA